MKTTKIDTIYGVAEKTLNAACETAKTTYERMRDSRSAKKSNERELEAPERCNQRELSVQQYNLQSETIFQKN